MQSFLYTTYKPLSWDDNLAYSMWENTQGLPLDELIIYLCANCFWSSPAGYNIVFVFLAEASKMQIASRIFVFSF